jgi:acetyltransferase
VELAIVFVPAGNVPAVLEACGRKGISRVMIQSAGFAEVGEPGKALQERASAIARGAGIRIWGPNCMGLVDVPKRHFFTFMHPRISQIGLLEGRISLIVQSGMLSAGFLAVMRQRSIGVSKACSIGNRADVDECDLLRYLLADPGTQAVALYLESVRKGREFAGLAAGSPKPIVLLKGGRSDAGARAAMSHTASLAGNSRLLDDVLRMNGVILASDFAQMMDMANAAAASRGFPSGGRTAVLTFSGASGILACDHLSAQGFELARFSPSCQERLDELFPEWMPASNPVDLFPAIERHGRVAAYEGALEAALRDPGVDMLFIHYFVGLEDEFLNLEALKRSVDGAGKSLALWLIGNEAGIKKIREEAHRLGVPAFEEISRAAEAMAAARLAGGRGTSRRVLRDDGTDLWEPSGPVTLPCESGVLDEHDSKRLLAEAGIPVIREKVIRSLEEAREEADGMGYPVVLKGLAEGVMHKTESGLVRLGIASPAELEAAWRGIREGMNGAGRVLIQVQAVKDFELMAGFIRDPQFGPCVLFGRGGVMSELDGDVVFGLAPLDRQSALDLMGRIRGTRLLDGFRGMLPLDRDRMADILVRLGDFGARHPRVAQIDINPLVVRNGVPIAVDAGIVLSRP